MGLATGSVRDEKVSSYFISARGHLDALGNIKPLLKGRPKKHVLSMLMAASGSIRAAKDMFLMKSAGLMYYMPCVAGLKSGQFRLTYAGLELLDHWAAKDKKFKPFVDAFVTNKARKEIGIASFFFTAGSLPPEIEVLLERHRVAQAKIDARKAEERAKYMAEVQKAMYAPAGYVSAEQNYKNLLLDRNMISNTTSMYEPAKGTWTLLNPMVPKT